MRNRIANSIIFGLLAPVTVYFMQSIVTHALPSSFFYDVADVEIISTEHHACSDIVYRFDRFSRVNELDTLSGVELDMILEKSDEHNIVYAFDRAQPPINEGHETIRIKKQLPCEIVGDNGKTTPLPEGQYRLIGIMQFKVNGVKKKETWESPTFTVSSIAESN